MKRLKLRDWLTLSRYRKEISENQNVPVNILRALALSDDTEYETLPWYETGEAFSSLLKANQIRLELPILKEVSKQSESPPWDYPEREWYFWAHLLSKNYGWTIEYVSELDVDDAVALMQEIELERQLEREWEYQLSEISYTYDPSSKKSRFVPLPRPFWMRMKLPDTIKVRKIPKKYLPVGNVIKVNENQNPDNNRGV